MRDDVHRQYASPAGVPHAVQKPCPRRVAGPVRLRQSRRRGCARVHHVFVAGRAFLDKEVTARFPNGLTVFDAYGQWLFRGAKEPNRLKTKVLVVLHEDTPQRRADIEAIRLAWKQATGHQSVLWSRHAVDVSF